MATKLDERLNVRHSHGDTFQVLIAATNYIFPATDSITLSIKEKGSTTPIITQTANGSGTGSITVTVPAATMGQLDPAKEYMYDLLYTNAGGIKETVFFTAFFWDKEVAHG